MNIRDRIKNPNIKNFERVTAELSPYFNDWEQDRIVEFTNSINGSKHDINPSVTESITQLSMIIGRDRTDECIQRWKQDNQKLLSVFGTLKYRNLRDPQDKTLYDGLDPEDKPEDYEKVYV